MFINAASYFKHLINSFLSIIALLTALLRRLKNAFIKLTAPACAA